MLSYPGLDFCLTVWWRRLFLATPCSDDALSWRHLGDTSSWRRLILVTPYLGDILSWRRLTLATLNLGDALSWRRLTLATPYLGDALSWRRLTLATPYLGDVFVFLIFDPRSYEREKKTRIGISLNFSFLYLGDLVKKPPGGKKVSPLQIFN